MSDIMAPIPFGKMMTWILEENKKGSIFGIDKYFKADENKTYNIFGRKLETPFGPAAGPHTQLTQNIVAAYVSGSRFFELKTVQKLDGEDLPVSKPCILAEDECYNCEWSTELYVPQAFDEYVKAWFILKVLAKELSLGAMDGFQFNISVGYDLEGIKLPKIDKFIEGMKYAADTPIFKECKNWLLDNINLFSKVTKEDVEGISPKICNSCTLSTLHGCPPQEIERIASYLLSEKDLHTFIKCNPTLLGYEYARSLMDEMGYDYVAFGDFHFKDDLQYSDAVPMLGRLQELANSKGLAFGVKITNTFPVDVKNQELPSEEMYMSGKSLYALSLSVAKKIADDFNGQLKISYSGGADFFNIDKIVGAGIWPVTMATTMLKPGGYQRLTQIGDLFAKVEPAPFKGVDAAKVTAMIEAAKADKHHRKAIKPLPSRKLKKPVPLTDCFVAPCKEGCPIHQDITAYMPLEAEGKHAEALKVILNKNPLPFITGVLCAHPCMSKCTRNFYEEPVFIRQVKLLAAENGFDKVLPTLAPGAGCNKKVAVVGGGPAGLSAAYFLARGGAKVTIFEKGEKLGGVIRTTIPEFRISHKQIDNDVEIVKAMGVEVVTGKEITSLDALAKDYDAVVLALGACEPGALKLSKGEVVNALEFLANFKASNGTLSLGENVIIIGGGNTAMDAARAAIRNKGVKKVSLVYRRTKRYMPADEEELRMAIEDGVEFAELLAPDYIENGQLVCKKMAVGPIGADGRASVVETGETVSLAADTVIAAVGEKVPGQFYENLGITLDSKRRPVVNRETLESSSKGIYIAGDGLFGPATIVEAIRDGRMAAEGILGRTLAEDIPAPENACRFHERKTQLHELLTDDVDGKRCFSCDTICENCKEVCPNRANLSIAVPGMEKHQILHVDYMCNECGNCKSFCPWDSAPYLDKFTLFANEADMENSKNQGFTVIDKEAGTCKVRLAGNYYDYTSGKASADIPSGLQLLMTSVINNYSYLFE